jgi:predicted transcriptional regulator with HTH domain
LIEQGNPQELIVKECLDSLGVSFLLDWEILIHLYRYHIALLGIDEIARLLHSEPTSVGRALERLKSRKLIESSRSSGVARFHTVAFSPDNSDYSYFKQLVNLSEHRSGRLTLKKILKPDNPRAEPDAICATLLKEVPK